MSQSSREGKKGLGTRIFAIVLLILAAACSRHRAPAAAGPTPSLMPAGVPSPPAPATTNAVIGDPVTYCVVRGGKLESVEIGPDSTYHGEPIARAFPSDSTYVGNTSWYRDFWPLALVGDRYIKYVHPRILKVTDVVPISTFRGVTVFAEPGANPWPPAVVYLPTRPGCEFQPYIRFGKM